MGSKPYLVLIIILTIVAVLTSPSLLRPFLQPPPTPTATPVVPTATATPTLTPDPFAHVPTVTPRAEGLVLEVSSLPSPALGELPPTYTPTPAPTSTAPAPSTPVLLLPDPSLTDSGPDSIPAASVPAPDRLRIPRLKVDVPVVPVGLRPVPTAAGYVSPALPEGLAAGWLGSSAGFGQPGNTVLTGRHQLRKMTVFHNLWTLEAGDEIILFAGEQSRRYQVSEVAIVPEQDQPLEVRLANSEALRPTEAERLTLVTGWPEKSSTHRTIVIAIPMNNE